MQPKRQMKEWYPTMTHDPVDLDTYGEASAVAANPTMEAPGGRGGRDVSRDRLCLRCKDSFISEWFGERICRRCKKSSSWKNGAPPRSFGPGSAG